MTDINWREAFQLGGLTVQPGERVHGELKLADGSISLPAAILHGCHPGKTMLITAGMHAAEYVGIQTALDLAQGLRLEKLAGTIIIVKVVNRPAFEQRKGSLGVTDGKNLYREFPGDPNGSEIPRLAWAVTTELFSVADYYIDLHSGDDFEQLTPYVYYAGKTFEKSCAMSQEMAQQVDVPYMVSSNIATGGAYNYASSLGIPSIMIERGGMGGWTKEEVLSTRRDIKNILCHLGIYKGQKDFRTYYPLDVVDVRYQDATKTGFWYPAKKPGDLILEGECLGEIKDYECKTVETVRAEFNGVILYQTGTLQVLENGPMIAYGRIVNREDNRKERIVKYWGKRSESFMEQKRRELNSPMAMRWLEEIQKRIPSGKTLNILDVGCGSGFFSILLAKQGHKVTGTDLTPEMVERSRLLAQEEGVSCEFMIMDAENLDFADESFDLVISRNLTWTLPHAKQAYSEWSRVLKPDGILLNYDANYGISNFAGKSDLPENHTHMLLGDEMLRECEEIKRQLPISSLVRPAWDVETLGQLNWQEFTIDLGLSKRIYIEKDEFYNPTPMFMICAKK